MKNNFFTQHYLSLLQKYNVRGPRYTSYPPANLFHEDFELTDYQSLLEENIAPTHEDIALYIHIPFCNRICHFCACNTSLKPDNETLIKEYVDCLLKEITGLAARFSQRISLSQIHWGGGTPHAIDASYIETIMQKLGSDFTIKPEAEISMECNPAYLQFDDYRFLHSLGFNRISLGIQDFNPRILEAINREPSSLPLHELVPCLKSMGITVNLDLIYGLPTQTLEDFRYNLEQAISLKPDRIANFSYAHVPWFKDTQMHIDPLPRAEDQEKMNMLLLANDYFIEAGYCAIGMDHFARKKDPLSLALAQNNLSRNFQGYTQHHTQVLALGASGITQLHGGFIQNTRRSKDYINKIQTQPHAYARAYKLSKEEKLCRDLISQLMCNTYISLTQLADKHQVSLPELRKIAKGMQWGSLIEDQLLSDHGDHLTIAPEGRFFVRNMAMACDPSLQTDTQRYSKTI